MLLLLLLIALYRQNYKTKRLAKVIETNENSKMSNASCSSTTYHH